MVFCCTVALPLVFAIIITVEVIPLFLCCQTQILWPALLMVTLALVPLIFYHVIPLPPPLPLWSQPTGSG